MPPEIMLHPYLAYTHPLATHDQCCPIIWDLRLPPSFSVSHIAAPGTRIPTFQLAQIATWPPVATLSIVCDVFPYEWPIEASNERGVTVFDVLQTIFMVARRPLVAGEWAMMSEKQRRRITYVYNTRWRRSQYPEWERLNGVVRADCLLGHTRFAGLTVVRRGSRNVCILTLSRNSVSG
ncbi:hypothetical protein PLICRDRAFT_647431 [Plicaturopsis crispa FD-325 SS-3]|nr:hypothetical protein PLICRDRAFT_647431 [Plicaturopsis crispa FD-325 SS-3]